MTTVTRRNALRSGTLAALAAGLIGATTKPADAAPSAPKRDTVYMADLTAVSRRAHQAVRESFETLVTVDAHVSAALTPDQRTLLREYENALTDHYTAAWEFSVSELARHLPMVAPAIVALWSHVSDGVNTPVECCRTTDWGGTDAPPAA